VVTTSYTYEPFGRTTVSGTSSTNPFAFTGREEDSTGALSLYHYRARYYSPALQRFLTEDPVGFAGGDANLYGYVGNAPTVATDQLGLKGRRGGDALVPEIPVPGDAPVLSGPKDIDCSRLIFEGSCSPPRAPGVPLGPLPGDFLVGFVTQLLAVGAGAGTAYCFLKKEKLCAGTFGGLTLGSSFLNRCYYNRRFHQFPLLDRIPSCRYQRGSE
jgi:RHS repeat-associated protein